MSFMNPPGQSGWPGVTGSGQSSTGWPTGGQGASPSFPSPVIPTTGTTPGLPTGAPGLPTVGPTSSVTTPGIPTAGAPGVNTPTLPLAQGSAFMPQQGGVNQGGATVVGGTTLGKVKPPVMYLYLALALTIIPLAIGFIAPSLWTWVGAWAACAFGALVLSSVFAVADSKKQMNLYYVAGTLAPILYTVVVVAALVGIAISALNIALIVGRI